MKVGDLVALSSKGQGIQMNSLITGANDPRRTGKKPPHGLIVGFYERCYKVRWFGISTGDRTLIQNHHRWELKKFRKK
tara:strand:+ start:351 stop:584 length:234 start_codon:yes stop_codon:yes gene_type:complete